MPGALSHTRFAAYCPAGVGTQHLARYKPRGRSVQRRGGQTPEWTFGHAKTPVPQLQEPGVSIGCLPSRQALKGVATQRFIRDRSSVADASKLQAVAFVPEACPELDNPPRPASLGAKIHLARWNHLLSRQPPDHPFTMSEAGLILLRMRPDVTRRRLHIVRSPPAGSGSFSIAGGPGTCERPGTEEAL